MAAPKNKQKFSVWLHPETLAKVNELYREDDHRSRSEFIEKAIRFYVGYLTATSPANYLPNIFLSNMRAIADESDNRMSRMLFKIAVEMSIMMNLIAADHDLDPVSMTRLRGQCVNEVKRLNGSFKFEDALKWQHG